MGTGSKSPQELCSSSSEDVLLVDGIKASAGDRRSKRARRGSADGPSTKSGGAALGAEKRDVEASVGKDSHLQTTSQMKKTRTSKSKEEEELPPGWVKVKSRSKPGAYYYAHPATKHTQAERPVAPRLAAPSTADSQRKAADEQRKAAEEQRKAAEEQRKAAEEQRKAEEAKQRAVQRAQEAEAEEAAREELLRRAREKRVREKTEEAVSLAQDNKPEAVEQEDSSGEEEVTLEDLAKWKEDEENLEQQGCMESPTLTPPDPAMQRRGEEEDGAPTNGVDPRCLMAYENSLVGQPMQPPFLQPCFQVLKFGVLVETHLLGGPKQSWTVGRATEHVDITLNHVSISRQHAVVMRHGAQMLLMDLGSTHGTALNGQRLEKNRPVPLTPGGRACFGASTRVFIYFESPSMVPTLSLPGSI